MRTVTAFFSTARIDSSSGGLCGPCRRSVASGVSLDRGSGVSTAALVYCDCSAALDWQVPASAESRTPPTSCLVCCGDCADTLLAHRLRLRVD